MTDPCAMCAQNTEIKVKPGIFACFGCTQMFCIQHVVCHRQELANQFDSVVGDRNELQDVVDRCQGLSDVSTQMNIIDQWVKKTVEQVYLAAEKLREQVIHLAEEQKTNFKDQFAELNKELHAFRENENYYEKDIQNLKEKCITLKRLLNPVDINVPVPDISSALTEVLTYNEKKMQ